MPYKTTKQPCKRSDGKKGNYVLKYKPKSSTSKKKDKQGYVKAGCHSSKEKAEKQKVAIEAESVTFPEDENVLIEYNELLLRKLIYNMIRESLKKQERRDLFV